MFCVHPCDVSFTHTKHKCILDRQKVIIIILGVIYLKLLKNLK